MKPMQLLRCAAAAVMSFTLLAPLAAPVSAEPEPKYIALTFDDGPNTTTTVEILDLLEEYNALGTFFLIGRNINEESAATVKRAYDMGCEIGNHSQTHANMPALSEEEMLAEISAVDEYVLEITGETTKYFRPPFIDTNDTMYEVIDKTFICGVGCNDFMADVTAQDRADAVIGAARDGLIVLLHDAAGNDQTVEALRTILPTLTEQGYQFVTLSQLFALQGETPRHGILYSEVAKYPCDDYTLHSNIFTGEATGDSSWSGWSATSVLDGSVLASLGSSYAVEVAYSGTQQPVLVLQKWSDGVSLWCPVQPAYYNGERACFLAEDVLAALEENGVTYEALDRITVFPYGGTITLMQIDLLVHDAKDEPACEGDVNGDGACSILDLVMLQKFLLGCGDLTNPAAADLNADAAVNVYDIGLLKKLLLPA